jgi:hypothetical protein
VTDLKAIYTHSPDIVTRRTGSEYVLVPVTNDIADMDSVYTLNETGAFIWELIDGKRNIDEIIGAVTLEYEVNYESAREDVQSFIKDMSKYLIISI